MTVHARFRLLFTAAVVAGFFDVAAPAWGQVINEDLKLLAKDGMSQDGFGYSIAIENDLVAVGAQMDDDKGTNSGSAYLFDASTGAQILKILPEDGSWGDQFGNAIAIDNGVVAVGAHRDHVDADNSGSAYLFDASTGAQIAKLVPNDGTLNAYFGWSIAIDDGIVAVGAYLGVNDGFLNGSAYLFDAITGDQIAKLVASDGAEGDVFGWSIAIDDGIVAVGAIGDTNENGSSAGSAYLFDASTGVQIAKLLPGDGARLDAFGASIAIANGVVAVGSPDDDDNGRNSGSVYLFDALKGTQISKLLPCDGGQGDRFGISIAIERGIVAVGGSGGTSAYLFDASSGRQSVKLRPSDGVRADAFGRSIGIDDGVVAVSAPGDDDNGTDSGSAYVFDVTPCIGDVNLDGESNLDDLARFGDCMTGPSGSPECTCGPTDLDGDGDVDMADYAIFQAAFGCP